ncbi:MAG: AsmA-like C-terminal region-containing protein [Marinifilaceae bacterium]|jgi:hypothetical protein|nr:AsmA-like C-terminal region-containing protein [Marinifilaceae bacterium]
MRILKRIGIILSSIILLIVLVAAGAIWYLFTPEKLTPLVDQQAEKYIDAQTSIKKIEPSFFGTYPFFGIEIQDLCISEKTNSDTIVYAKTCLASVDISSFVFDGDIKLNPFLLEGGYLNLKIDKQAKANFDIMKSDGTSQAEEESAASDSSSSIGNISLDNIRLKNFRAKYLDETSLMFADVDNLNANLSLNYNGEDVDVETNVDLKKLIFQTSDSLALDLNISKINLNIEAKGNIKNSIDAELSLKLPNFNFGMEQNKLVSNMNISTKIPLNLDMSQMKTKIKNAIVKFNEYSISLEGLAKINADSSIDSDIKFSTNNWNIEKMLQLVPEAYAEPMKGLVAKGIAKCSGTVKGKYSNNSFPKIIANLDYNKGYVKYAEFPAAKNISTSVTASVDMNENGKTNLDIHSASANLMHNNFKVSGRLSDLMNIPAYDIKAKANILISDFKDYIPKDMNLLVNGRVKADIHTKFNQSAIDKEQYHRIFMKADVAANDFNLTMDDTIKLKLPKANIIVDMPGHRRLNKNSKFVNLKIDAPDLFAEASANMKALTKKLKLSIDVNDMVPGYDIPKTKLNLEFEELSASVDTIGFNTNGAIAEFSFDPIKKDKKKLAIIKADLDTKSLAILNREQSMFDLKNLNSTTNLLFDETQTNPLLQWNPIVDMSFDDGNFYLDEKLNGKIPNTSFTLTPEAMEVKKANVIIGNSDFNLSGVLSNISDFLKEKAILRANFDFVSDKTDVMELMDIFNGMGNEEAPETASVTHRPPEILAQAGPNPQEEEIEEKDDPFMVPKRVDLHINTNISKTIVNGNLIENIKGGVTVKNGAVVLEEVGFTSKAAQMQLTGIYKSPRKDHLYTSFDFHLLDIKIDELLKLVPYVDTIVPMIKSFDGTGEFHFSVETSLYGNYEPKMSTLRGAAAFAGNDLVVMDNETFDMMAKYLLFKKKTVNKIDSVGVEMSIFRDRVTLFPFLIVMDKYKAVMDGRHNLDNSFDYHISVTDSPLPVKLGMRISGTIDSLDYGLEKCKYKNLFRPKKVGAMEKQQLELKKIIFNSLKANVKKYD